MRDSVGPLFRSCRAVPLLLTLALIAGASAPGRVSADDKASQAGKRTAVAKLVTETASLLRREAPDKPWQIVKQNEPLYTGDLLLGGAGATLETTNGAVRVALLGDMNGLSPHPIVETAVILHQGKDGADLGVTLDRGRINVINKKDKGAARVRVDTHGRGGEIVLKDAGATVAVEVYGRWLKGVRFHKSPKPGEAPTLASILLVLKGEIELNSERRQFSMKAPPGPAMLIGDDLNDVDATPGFLEKVPEWATEQAVTERAKKLQAALAKLRQGAAAKSIGEAVDELVKSENEFERQLGVNILAALDDLPRLALAMQTAKHRDVWENGVLALRHWIGRGPGQDQKLYQALVEKAKLPEAEAEIVLNLLHSFGDDDLARPETYELLIDYLESEKLPIRSLAIWHLIRLVPEGRKYKYNALAPKEDRDRAVKEWRKLVPSGQLPPKSGKSEGK